MAGNVFNDEALVIPREQPASGFGPLLLFVPKAGELCRIRVVTK
jgi:hypothetical protein